MLRTMKLAILTAALAAGTSACLLPPLDSVSVTYVDRGPPPSRVEFYDVAPGPGYIWVAGYWSWGSGDYYWVPGRWSAPPRGYRHWESGRWVRRGHRWYYREGRWRR